MSAFVKGWKYSNISASTGNIDVPAGKYMAGAVATFGGGSVKLQRLLADGTTYASVSSATDFTAAGNGTVDLPEGTYRFTIATATAVYADLVPIYVIQGS